MGSTVRAINSHGLVGREAEHLRLHWDHNSARNGHLAAVPHLPALKARSNERDQEQIVHHSHPISDRNGVGSLACPEGGDLSCQPPLD